ncbi:hypothetical protein [Malaciobacter halophilus]|nr:hypothetical protein [Malaciobacter halophilus]
MNKLIKIIAFFIALFLILSLLSFVVEPRAIKNIYSWQEVFK